MRLTPCLSALFFLLINFTSYAQMDYGNWDVPADISSNGRFYISGEEIFYPNKKNEMTFRYRNGNTTSLHGEGLVSANAEIRNVHVNQGSFFISTDEGLIIRSIHGWTKYDKQSKGFPSSNVRTSAQCGSWFVVVTDSGVVGMNEIDNEWMSLTTTLPMALSLIEEVYLWNNHLYISGTDVTFHMNIVQQDWTPMKGYFFDPKGFIEWNQRLYAMTDEYSQGAFSSGAAYSMVRNDTFLTEADSRLCFEIPTRYSGVHILKGLNENVFFLEVPQDQPDNDDIRVVHVNGQQTATYFIPYEYAFRRTAMDNTTGDILLQDGRKFNISQLSDFKSTSPWPILDINNVRIPASPVGGISVTNDFPVQRMSVPADICRTTIPYSNMWIGGLDTANELHLMGQTYWQLGTNDQQPGPLDPETGSFDANDAVDFNRVWKINKSDIDAHLDLYRQKGFVDKEQTTADIWEWPAHYHGDPSTKLAPFVDQNQNGVYEPAGGDVPLIKGDQALFWIYNDNMVHRATYARRLGFEVHVMLYAYGCDLLPSLNETFFMEYTIFNRSTNKYSELYAGNWIDFDIGFFRDDFVGCHVGENMGYAYNGDKVDEGNYGYGHQPSMQSICVLNSPTEKHDGKDNDGDGEIDEADEAIRMSKFGTYSNDFSTYGNPTAPLDYYNYLQGKWKNGETYTADCRYGQTGVVPTDYLYYGNTVENSSCGNWTEQTAGNATSDRKAIVSNGPIELDPGQKAVFEYAFVFSSDTSGKHDSMLSKNVRQVREIKEWYYDEGHPPCYDPILSKPSEELIDIPQLGLFPNPANSEVSLHANSLIEEIDIYSINGLLVHRYTSVDHKNPTVTIAELEPGAYVVRAKSNDGIASARLIKR